MKPPYIKHFNQLNGESDSACLEHNIFNRLLNGRRQIKEQRIIQNLTNQFPTPKGHHIVYTSIGAGRLLQDYILVLKMIDQGFTKFTINLIDVVQYPQLRDEIQTQANRLFLQYIQALMNELDLYIEVNWYGQINEYIEENRSWSDIITLIDFEDTDLFNLNIIYNSYDQALKTHGKLYLSCLDLDIELSAEKWAIQQLSPMKESVAPSNNKQAHHDYQSLYDYYKKNHLDLKSYNLLQGLRTYQNDLKALYISDEDPFTSLLYVIHNLIIDEYPLVNLDINLVCLWPILQVSEPIEDNAQHPASGISDDEASRIVDKASDHLKWFCSKWTSQEGIALNLTTHMLNHGLDHTTLQSLKASPDVIIYQDTEFFCETQTSQANKRQLLDQYFPHARFINLQDHRDPRTKLLKHPEPNHLSLNQNALFATAPNSQSANENSHALRLHIHQNKL